jgi:hypothetical protein
LGRAKHSEIVKTIKEIEIQTAWKYSESTQTKKYNDTNQMTANKLTKTEHLMHKIVNHV